MQPEVSIELKMLAIAVGLSIVIAIFISLLPKKPKKLKVGSVYWTADAYFNHLKKKIILSDNIAELSANQAAIEGFRVKTFRGVFRRDRKRLYKLLKDAYESKERDLILHPKMQQLCKS